VKTRGKATSAFLEKTRANNSTVSEKTGERSELIRVLSRFADAAKQAANAAAVNGNSGTRCLHRSRWRTGAKLWIGAHITFGVVRQSIRVINDPQLTRERHRLPLEGRWR